MHADMKATSQRGELHPTDNIIPQMTAFFIDCFTVGNKRRAAADAPAVNFHQVVRSAVCSEAAVEAIKGADLQLRGKATPRGPAKIDNQVTIRTLVQFISHNFNNILMGIWGNVSLMRMGLNHNHPVQACIAQTETLIQDGAFFIHLILGYLAERRVVAKRLRLNQLVDAITLHVPDAVVRKELVRQLQVNAALRRPRAIAGSTARILDHLMTGIEALCRDIDTGIDDYPKVKGRTSKINDLIAKGRAKILLLNYYAGQNVAKKRQINLRCLMERQLRRINADHPGVYGIQTQMSKDIILFADRSQIEWMLGEVLDVNCRMAGRQGQLVVRVKSWSRDPAHAKAIYNGEFIEISIINVPEQNNPAEVDCKDKKLNKSKHHTIQCAAVNHILKNNGGFMYMPKVGDNYNTICIYLPEYKLQNSNRRQSEFGIMF
jgi:hypothetical protein